MNGDLITNKQRYRELCQIESSIPLFAKDWWLDTVCGYGNWDVTLVEKGGNIVASMPWQLKRKYGFTLIGMPSLTQSLGPWIRPSMAKYANQIGHQKKVMLQLIQQLPAYDYFNQNFHYSITNWQPFYWSGFNQTTRYTYLINELPGKDELWENLLPNIRREIKKAIHRFGLHICSDFSVDTFLDVNEKTFKRQNMPLPYPRSLVYSIHKTCVKREACKMFFAVDSKERIHAGAFIVWDENSAYYLLGGGDPVLRNSGAMSLILWEAILFAAKVTKKFDFEGSMIEPIEKFFRAFGAVQTPYFCVTKNKSRLLQLYRGLRAFSRC